MLKPGDPAPDFDVTDANGQPLRLRDYRGKNVVLWFFPKANTSG
jgi:peroxiredoxin Q/BCP